MSYATPQALRAALTSVARRHAREHGLVPGELVDRFYFQRLLARVFHTDPHGWLLKGGQALLVRYPNARHSRDIDLYRPQAGDLDEAVRTLVAAAEVDLGDHLRYTLRKRTTIVKEGSNTRLTFAVSAGTKSAGAINVDVVVGLSPQGQPVHRRLEPAVPLTWPDDWPTVALYPLVDHIADKICALYERHGADRIPSTRYRDLVDLILIIIEEPIDGRLVQTILRREANRRRQLGTDLDLPSSFDKPVGPHWSSGYRAAAATVPALREHRTLDQASVLARTFLDPVLSPDDPGLWTPRTRTWASRG